MRFKIPRISLGFHSSAGELSSDIASRATLPKRSITKLQYVQDFLRWWKQNQLPEELEWKRVISHSYEFSEYSNIEPLTAMSLCKALQRYGIPKRWRYLRADEAEFQRKRGFGDQRPRVLMIGMGQIKSSTEPAQQATPSLPYRGTGEEPNYKEMKIAKRT